MPDTKDLPPSPDVEGPSPFDETAALKSVQKQFASLLKPLEAVAKVKIGGPDSLAAFDKAVSALPDATRLAHALTELTTRAVEQIVRARQERVEGFRRAEADWVRGRRAAGSVIREVGATTWRTGLVEVEVERETAQARVRYNREPIGSPQRIRSPQDLELLVESAEKQLRAAEIESNELRLLLSDAFEHLKLHKQVSGQGRATLAALYREFRICLARRELAGKADRKLATAEFPRWAFLYNVDRYRAASQHASTDKLFFETGSSNDHQKGLAMILNGIDPAHEYKSYCYVYSAGK